VKINQSDVEKFTRQTSPYKFRAHIQWWKVEEGRESKVKMNWKREEKWKMKKEL
jgi:hypothetical protein